ncbi:MAG: SWIM zinc finger family protein [Candidatus Brocadiae bacterium]|nr:SWIM zinc finger family protein [Candidatus Brocadiia bacterium]
MWGLTEGHIVDGGSNVSISEMSRFIIEQYGRIYERMMEIFITRCWRFPDCYVDYQGEEFTDPTLVVRRRMLDVPLPDDVRQRTDAAIESNRGNKWGTVNALYEGRFQQLSQRGGFDVRMAWDIYRFRAFEEYGARIIAVEDMLEPEFWQDVRKRVRAARSVKVEKAGGKTYIANGFSTKYEVDVARVKCTCPDFQHRGRRYGLHCKHLVAALKQEESWENHWGAYIPG